MEIDNLDFMSQRELHAARQAFNLLAQYCEHKDTAIHHRLRGNVKFATEFETRCDEIYRELPKEYQW